MAQEDLGSWRPQERLLLRCRPLFSFVLVIQELVVSTILQFQVLDRLWWVGVSIGRS